MVAIEMLEKGMSHYSIAKITGLSKSEISRR